MELDRYVSEAAGHCDELIEELREQGIRAVFDLCVEIGERPLAVHLSENQTAYLRATSDTPSARKRKLRAMDPRDQIIYRLAVLYLTRHALGVLAAVCDHQIGPGDPYRQTTARCAAAALQIARGEPSFWPFEDHPDPFADV